MEDSMIAQIGWCFERVFAWAPRKRPSERMQAKPAPELKVYDRRKEPWMLYRGPLIRGH